jgi:4-aminobutyrate--pyruvate transaminase
VSRPLREAMALCPPLIITEAQVDELFDKLGRALDRTLAFARDRRLVG